MYFFRRTFLAFKTRIFLQFRAKKVMEEKVKREGKKVKKRGSARAPPAHFSWGKSPEKWAQERRKAAYKRLLKKKHDRCRFLASVS